MRMFAFCYLIKNYFNIMKHALHKLNISGLVDSTLDTKSIDGNKYTIEGHNGKIIGI